MAEWPENLPELMSTARCWEAGAPQAVLRALETSLFIAPASLSSALMAAKCLAAAADIPAILAARLWVLATVAGSPTDPESLMAAGQPVWCSGDESMHRALMVALLLGPWDPQNPEVIQALVNAGCFMFLDEHLSLAVQTAQLAIKAMQSPDPSWLLPRARCILASMNEPLIRAASVAQLAIIKSSSGQRRLTEAGEFRKIESGELRAYN